MSTHEANENVFGNILNNNEENIVTNLEPTLKINSPVAPLTTAISIKKEIKANNKVKSVSFQIHTPNKTIISRPPLQNLSAKLTHQSTTKKTSTPSVTTNIKSSTKPPLSHTKQGIVSGRVQTPGGFVKRIFPTSPPQPAASSSSSLSSETSRNLNTSVQSTPTDIAREAAILARQHNMIEKQRQTVQEKERWVIEREERLRLQKEAIAEHQRKLHSELEKQSETRRRNQDAQEQLQRRQQELEREQLAASLEDRAHVAREMEMAKKQRRRQSVLLNTEILQHAREKDSQIKMQSLMNEKDWLEARRLNRLSEEQAQLIEKMRRRASMATRGEESRRQRDIAEQLQREKQSEEASLLEFRRAAWVDREAVRAAELQKDREILATKLDSWRKDKDVEKKLELKEEVQRQQDLNARRSDWLDVQFYKSEMARSHRESLASRLEQWRVEKTVEILKQHEQAEAEECDQLLRVQAQHDVDTFKREIEQNRRASLAGRLAFEIQAKERQKSEIMKVNEEASVNFALTEGEWREQRQVQEVQRELRRKSIVANYMESKRQYEYDVQCHRRALDDLHKELSIKREEWLDEQSHKQEREQRRRQSVCVRLDSWRQQRMAEEMLTMKKRLLAEEDAELQRLDFEAVKLARDQAKQAEIKAFSNTRLHL